MTEEINIWYVVDPIITEEAMVTFAVKNIQVGHPKDTNEKKFDGRKNVFFVLNVFNTAKKMVTLQF